MTQAELAKKLNLSETSINRHLKHLHKTRLIKQIDSERKWKYIELTPKGIALVNEKQNPRFAFRLFSIILAIVLAVGVFALVIEYDEEIQDILGIKTRLPTATPTISPTPTAKPAPTLTGDGKQVIESTPTPTSSPAPSPSPIPTPQPSSSPTPNPSPTPPPFDFQLSLEPNGGSVPGAGQVNSVVRVNLTSGEPRNTRLNVSGCPAYTQCGLDNSSGMPTFATQLRITTTTNTSQGIHQIIVTANGGAIQRQAVFTLNISSTFDFSIGVQPSNLTIRRGENKTATVTLNLLSGPTQQLSLTHKGCPSLSTCSFSPNSGQPTFSSIFTIFINQNTTIGQYGMTLIATGGNLSKTVELRVDVI